MSLKTQNHKFLEVITKIKENATGFKNEVNEVVDDFTSVAVKYITDLHEYFDEMEKLNNTKITELKKEVEDQKNKNEFEEHNYNRVSFIKQQDKEINQSKLKIEELESKLRFAESEINRLKSKPSLENNINLDTFHLTTIIDTDKDKLNEFEIQTLTSENESSNDIVSEVIQCLARIGRKRDRKSVV